jgi:purine catabolism regulator
VWTLPPAVRADNAYIRKVRLLIDYDRAKGADLLATLDAYLQHGGALTQAAATLFVHRHTLTYRLDKIERLCDLDLSAPLVRLNLQVALIEYRLHGDAERVISD